MRKGDDGSLGANIFAVVYCRPVGGWPRLAGMGANAAMANQQGAGKKFQAVLLTPDWNIKCSSVPAANGFNCQMTRAIVLKNTRQLLLKMSVRLPAQTKKPVMLLQLPHGLFLPAGITLRIDKNTSQTQVVQTCDKKGCYAGMPIASGMLAALKKGQQLNVSFQNLKKAPTTVPVPLDGFTKAYEQMIQR